MKKQNKIFALFIVIVLCVGISNGANGMMLPTVSATDCQATPSLWAAYQGDLDTLKQMKEKNELNVNEQKLFADFTILDCAHLGNNWEVVRFLIENGANIQGGNVYPSMEDSLGKFSPEMVHFLIKKGLKVHSPALTRLPTLEEMKKSLLKNGTNFDGMNEVQINNVVASKITETARIFLEQGADVNYKERQFFNSPIIYATKNGNFPLIQLLLEHGADVNHSTCKQKNALDIATEQSEKNPKYDKRIIPLLEKHTNTVLSFIKKKTASECSFFD